MSRSTPARLRNLPWATVLGVEVPVASVSRVRLLGLAFLDVEAAGPGLLIPDCRAVHTVGMRFRLDVVFLDASGGVAAVRRAVPPRRFLAERRAASVLELLAGRLPAAAVSAAPRGADR